MARFPPGFIDDLKAQADIVQVIQDVVPLKQAGRTFKGLCPFHQEKTPSFNVDREKGFFHCFGCSTGGDVVKFVELYEKVGFPEAVQSLAQRLPDVPESETRRATGSVAEREALLRCTSGRQYWRANASSPDGARVIWRTDIRRDDEGSVWVAPHEVA